MRKSSFWTRISLRTVTPSCPSISWLAFAATFLFASGRLAPAAAPPDYAKDVKPLLESYCFKCHANGKKKGNVALDTFTTADSAVKDPKTWQAVLDNVRGGDMPPDDEEKQPKLEERECISQWIERTVFAIDPDHPDPGRVTIRRLNRAEYNNTIRDLLGVDFEPANDFPADDTGYGFDNIGDVLSTPPVLFERYLAAAEKVMSLAILNDHKPRAQTVKVDLLAIKGGPDKGNTPTARRLDERTASVEIDCPLQGLYTAKLEVVAPRIGADPTKLEFKCDGQAVMVPPLIGDRDATQSIKLAVQIPKAGRHTITLAVSNPLAVPEKKDGKPVNRTITLRQLAFVSPPQSVTAPDTQLRIFAAGRGQASLPASARAILSTFAARAFRRPLQSYELDRLMFIYSIAQKKGGNFEQAVQTALTVVLVSPHFLFRGEVQPTPDNPHETVPIDEWALASRLSYFLWSTMPDAKLFAEAQAGTLRKNLGSEVRRMLADPKSQALVDNFAGQWLQTRNLAQVHPDPHTFPEWDKLLGKAMERETQMLFEHVMHEDRPVTDFIAADYTFVNERLAKFYGIDGVEGEAFVKVKLPAKRPGGILGQGSFLTITSNPTRTSPVKRGKYVLETLLGTPPPPPPPDVPDLNDPKRGELHGTLRQKMEAHRTNAICASCHQRMDPLGFGLENFDGIGQWRDKEGQSPIDSSGTLVSGEQFNGPVELQKILLTKKRGDFLRCISGKMLTFALGRGLEYYDRPAVDKIVANLEKGGVGFSALVLETVKAVPFEMRRGEGDHRKFAAGN